MTYIVHPIKAWISGAVCVVSAILATTLLLGGYWLAGAVFAACAALYGWTLNQMAARVSITQDGVTMKPLLGKQRALPWRDVREAGVIGIGVIKHRMDDQKTGPKYIYFSPRTLTEDERFQLGLRWPPKKQLYLRFSHDRVKTVKRYWKTPLELYNTADLYLGDRPKEADE